MSVKIRAATVADREAVWGVVEPVVAAGDAFVFEGASAKEDALAMYFHPAGQCFVAEVRGEVVGAYVVKPNQPGRGSHVANAAYAVHPSARGMGVARAMGEHSLEVAKAAGYRAMQFNIVVSTNEAAVRLWASLGFVVLARLPGAFRHAELGEVDALVMWRSL